MTDRRQDSYAVRVEAAELARSRQHPLHEANGDEERYANEQYFMSFTKGLPHNPVTGLLQDPTDFVAFRRAIDDGFIDSFSDRVRHGALWKVTDAGIVQKDPCPDAGFRQWEAPTAGVTFELQGPDAQAVTMLPAPGLLAPNTEVVNPELVFEMAEVYELAVLRDVPFNHFEGTANNAVKASADRLSKLAFISEEVFVDSGRPRKVNAGKKLDLQTVFRGSSFGVEVGPYLSQFLLIGTTDLNGSGSVADGQIGYGTLQIDQRVPVAQPTVNYMTDIDSYVSVQRGISQTRESYVEDPARDGRTVRRFISTPRDLATYVHYDALYEAYLNACLILLGMGTPFDPAFDHLSGGGVAAGDVSTRRNAGGFALYGGPHILNLVTEVSTRALKAVRFQKFNNHIRLRPEALAARLEILRKAEAEECKATLPKSLVEAFGKFAKALSENDDRGGTLAAVKGIAGNNSYFLPMAFPEGSPMHPAYGAGHATVAGACVTILKAFFDTGAVFVKEKATGAVSFRRIAVADRDKFEAVAFRAPDLQPLPDNNDAGKPFAKPLTGRDVLPAGDAPQQQNLQPFTPKYPLTLEGELNKLASNISIGRNMAGVHYFTDYFDSARMGEEIAIGILEEQALTYSTDPFVLSIPTFDGQVRRIGRR